MKKILLIIGAGSCLATAAIIAMVVMANRVGDSVQRDFFAVVATNDAEAFLLASDPRMRNEVDAPLLKQWMQALNDRLGPYQGLDPTDFHSSTRFEGGSRIVETKGTVLFESGKAYSELSYVDDKLAHFHVTSDRMEDSWFREPDDTTIYRSQAETFYAELVNNNIDAAYDTFSDQLKQTVSIDQFRTLAKKIQQGLGSEPTVRYVDDEFLDSPVDGQRLVVRYTLAGSEATYHADVVFVFDGLTARLTEFNAFPDSTESPTNSDG